MSIIIVACHHKAGSSYAKKCFSEVASILGRDYHFFGFGELPGTYTQLHLANQILCFSHARYDHLEAIVSRLRGGQCKLVHFIRDPRTLIVSATKYHINSDEHWLSIPKTVYGGKSYQQYIKDLPCYSDQMIFEMSHGSLGALQQMGGIHTRNLATITIKLEEISWDRSGLVHQQLSEHLTDESAMQRSIKSVFLKYSLFSLQAPPKHARTMLSPAVREDLNGNALQLYRELYGSLHSTLGYED